MSDSLLASVLRSIFYVTLTLFLIIVFLFVYNNMTVNSYISQAHSVVSRSGGLTGQAYLDLNRISAEHYHGMFHVSIQPSLSQADRSGWGTRDDNNLKSVALNDHDYKDLDDNKGFTPDTTGVNKNTISHATQNNSQGVAEHMKLDYNYPTHYHHRHIPNFGQRSSYYVYIDIPYGFPYIHNDGISWIGIHAPVEETFQSSIRPGSQY